MAEARGLSIVDGRGTGPKIVFVAATLGALALGVSFDVEVASSLPPLEAAGFSIAARHGLTAIVTSLGFLFGLAYRRGAGPGVQVFGHIERVLFAAGLLAALVALAAAVGLGKASGLRYGGPGALAALLSTWGCVTTLGFRSATPARGLDGSSAPSDAEARAMNARESQGIDDSAALAELGEHARIQRLAVALAAGELDAFEEGAALRELAARGGGRQLEPEVAAAIGVALRKLCARIDGAPFSARERAQSAASARLSMELLMRRAAPEASAVIAVAVRLDSIGASQLRQHAVELLAASPHWLHVELLLEALPRELPVIAAHAIDALSERLDPFHEDELAALSDHGDEFVARIAAAVVARRARDAASA